MVEVGVFVDGFVDRMGGQNHPVDVDGRLTPRLTPSTVCLSVRLSVCLSERLDVAGKW